MFEQSSFTGTNHHPVEAFIFFSELSLVINYRDLIDVGMNKDKQVVASSASIN